MLTKNDYKKINKVVNRVFKDRLNYADRLTIMMDIECAIENTHLDLDKLLGFNKFNFAHDIYGIAKNINRQTKTIDNCFLPRSA